MGAVDTSSPRPLKLNMSKGVINKWDPDTGNTTEHKGWEAWILDFEYKSNADHPDERFRHPELILSLHDGDRPALLAIRMGSGSFRQFVCCIENANLRQPVTFRPWYKEKDGKKFGGINLYQGDVQLAPKYSKKDPNGLPEVTEVMNEATMKMEKNYGPQMKFLRGIMDNHVKPLVKEIRELKAYEEAPKAIGPMVPLAKQEQLALPPATEQLAAGGTPGATTNAAPPANIEGDDESDLPF